MKFMKISYVMLAVLIVVTAGLPALADTRQIYSPTADAHADIQQALSTAAREHKRVILDFGGNWCGDCQVLDIYFHDLKNIGLLNANYVLVHVDIGRMDHNTDIAEKYGVPLNKGVPGLAVLDAHGRVIYSQRNARVRSHAPHGRVLGDRFSE